MIITDKLSKYRSKEYCNLDLFRIEPQGHSTKRWQSKDGTEHLIKEMETRHLWYTFNMLQGIIDTENFYISGPEPQGEMAYECFLQELDMAMEQADFARVAIQYIGHELYKRGAQVPKIPEKNFKMKINRADNLHHGFADNPGEVLTYKDDWDE